MTGLPRGWVRTTIGSIADLINGRAFKPSEWGSVGLPIVRIQNLNREDAPFNYYSGRVSPRHIIERGDLLFAWSGTPGTSFGAHIWQGPTAILNQHIFKVLVDPEHINRRFLRLAINQTLDEQIAKAHGGAGLRHVTKSAFEKTEIALPPLAEQERIVERLDLLDERVALARRRVGDALHAVEEARAALLQGAYSLSLLPKSEGTGSERKLRTVTVADVASDISYGSSAKSSKQGTVPVIRMGNIQGGELDWNDLAYTSDPAEIERYALRPGDVLFNRTNSPQQVGKTAVYRGERPAIFAGYIIRVRCNERMLPDYLAFCLNSPAGRRYSWLVKSDGVSQSNINAKKLADFRLPCPSIEDQQLVIDLIQSARARLATVVEQSEKTVRALDRLYHQTTAQALSGELGTGRSSDEPAQIQLEHLERARRVPLPRDVVVQVGVAIMKRSVVEILKEASDWMPADEIARLYGIAFGATPEDVEPFYAELRELDAGGRLAIEPIRDKRGAKVGERLRLQEPA